MEAKGIAIAKKNAQALLETLSEEGLLQPGLRPGKGKEKVIFPISASGSKVKAKLLQKFPKAKIVDFDFEETLQRPRSIKDALKGKLSPAELKLCPSSFDTLGDSAILELEDDIKPKAKIIAEALLNIGPSIKTVYLKTGAHQGVFREEPVEYLAGERKEFALYKEHGCIFRISVGKVFFTPRLSTERKRIAGLIRPGEKVACLFAGVGPFPIVFAKNSKMSEAIAIELNPVAVGDMKENVIANKVEGKVFPVLGDVKELSEKKVYCGKFDRAVMPLPKGGEDFLADAIRYIKPEGGVVHYYQFVPVASPFEIPERQIAAACAGLGRKFEILAERKVRDYSPDTVQVVVDFMVWGK